MTIRRHVIPDYLYKSVHGLHTLSSIPFRSMRVCANSLRRRSNLPQTFHTILHEHNPVMHNFRHFYGNATALPWAVRIVSLHCQCLFRRTSAWRCHGGAIKPNDSAMAHSMPRHNSARSWAAVAVRCCTVFSKYYALNRQWPPCPC